MKEKESKYLVGNERVCLLGHSGASTHVKRAMV